jgi:hypothetical protein
MTILEAIQEATDASGAKGLSFANIQEFNAFNDSFAFEEYSRNVVVPFKINYTFTNNRVKGILILQGWMITRVNQDTNDWRSVDMEPAYISPMRDQAVRFLKHLLNSDIVDPEIENMTASITPEHMWLKDHLFGVSYQANIPISKMVC